MKNRFTGRLGRLFLNAVALESRSPGSVVMKTRNTTDTGLKPSSMTSFYNGKKPSICFGGFTLIELLVVVLIIGILAAVALPQYQKAVLKSRFATVKATVRALSDAQKTYFMANGEFAPRLDELDIQVPKGTVSGSGSQMNYSWGACYLACDSDNQNGVKANQCGGCLLLKDGKNKINYFNNNFETDKLFCVVYDDAEPIYTDLCRSETGKNAASSHYADYSLYAY